MVPVSRKSRKRFGSEKTFITLRSAYSVRLVFSYVVKGIKIIITAKFRAWRHLRFEDTKRIMSREMRSKSFGTLRNRPQYSPVSRDPGIAVPGSRLTGLKFFHVIAFAGSARPTKPARVQRVISIPCTS